MYEEPMRYKYFLLIFITIIELIIPFKSDGKIDNVQFYNLNEEYGISIRETNQVLRDNYGFVWISSKMGVVRYSQDDIRTYQLPFDSEDIITVNLVYKNETLFAYTNNGQILKYNSIQDKFKMIVNISKLLKNPYIVVNKILVDERDRIWLSTTFGLYSYSKETGLKSHEQGQIQHVEWFDETHFFYAVNGKIKLYNVEDFSNSDYYAFPSETKYNVSYLFYDYEYSTLWIGTLADGLFYLNKEDGNFKLKSIPEIPDQPVLAIEENSDSTFLIGVDGQGVWEVNKFEGRILNIYKEDANDPTSLKGNGVYDIYCDQENRVWVCTYSGGVSFFDQANPYVTQISHVINNPNSLVNNDVNSVFQDSDGKIWFATNNGVSCWDVSSNRWKSFFHNKKEQAQVFLSIYGDKQGRIWAGTYSSGVYVIDSKTGIQLAHYSSSETEKVFDCDFVFDIYEDSQGNIWIGGVQSDLICYQVSDNKFISYPDLFAYTIREYETNKILIGTTYGLVLLNKISGKVINLVEGYIVRDFHVDDDLVWLCTSGDGLIQYNFKSRETKKYTVESGLPSNFVNGITKSDGYLWMGTENGMCRLNPADNSIHTFNSIIPLASVSFNANSHFCLDNGRLLIWGTSNGAVIFDPKAIQVSQSKGQIYYQDLLISGQSIRDSAVYNLEKPLDSLKNLSLKYYQNTISIELIPIEVNSSGSKFSWKLDGLDQEWSKPSSNRILSYSNIPSDQYSLRIRMYDSSLSNIIAERSLNLKIVPPFWNTWWFRAVAFLFAGGVALLLLIYYIDRLKKEHSEEKIRFFANTAHDIRTSLTLIKGPVEELNKESGLSNKGLDYLHLATEQTQRLAKVVTQLMDFQKVDVGKERLTLKLTDIVEIIENRVMMFESLAKTKNIRLKFVSNQTKFVTAVDEGMIEKVIDNLISNAIKYSFPETQVKVKLDCLKSKWTLVVQDQGIGIGRKAQKQLFKEFYRGDNAINSKIVGSGIGLLLVKNYVNLHGGKVSCESQENTGSTFEVVIPVSTMDERKDYNTERERRVILRTAGSDKLVSQTLSEVDTSSAQKMKVLIVEDHEYLREFLKSAMDSEFFIKIAENGEAAWQLIQKEAPDLIVSDIMMPKMDGYDFCRKIKETYETSHIPIILLTALSGKAEHLRGLGLGADDYLTKPFDVTLLKQRIKTIIQNRELIRDRALKIIKYNEEDNAILDNELNDQFVKKMVEIVRQNIGNSEFSKDDFASAMNVSPSLLYKKVKSLTNQSPTDFIKSIRLDYALDLIHSKKYTITEISELCGFSSVGYFSTVFRKHYGKSPTQVV